MSHPEIFCVRCGGNSCLHIQQSHATVLTPREVSILRAIADPASGTSPWYGGSTKV
jgi:hypothetical protein